jgi:hypothetical protein
MFKVAGVPMVENCIAGYNSCMFAYGQVKLHSLVPAQVLILCLPFIFNAYLLLLGWKWKNTYDAW